MPLLRPRAVRADKPAAGRTPVAAGEEDNGLKAILKWVPIEVIGFYQAVMAAVPTERWDVRLWLTVAAIPICAGWIAFATKPASKDYAWRQIVLAVIAFVLWGTAVQSEVLHATVSWWEPWFGTVLLLAGGMLLPIFDGILMRLKLTQMK